MEQEIASLTSTELVELYHRISSELRKNLLSGSPWAEQQPHIKTLGEISTELSRRKIEIVSTSLPTHHNNTA
jgi:hypothetical protein